MARQPCQALEDALTRGRAAWLHLPRVISGYPVQLQHVRDVLWLQRAANVLLVGKHKQQCILHLAVLDDAGELRPRLVHALPVVGVDDEYETLCA